jgi:hypothetical protein
MDHPSRIVKPRNLLMPNNLRHGPLPDDSFARRDPLAALPTCGFTANGVPECRSAARLGNPPSQLPRFHDGVTSSKSAAFEPSAGTSNSNFASIAL